MHFVPCGVGDDGVAGALGVQQVEIGMLERYGVKSERGASKKSGENDYLYWYGYSWRGFWGCCNSTGDLIQ